MSNKPHILIVDDEINICKILQMAFEKIGFKATVTHDAFSALNAFQNETPNVVLTDVTMPGKNGYELLKEIKAQNPDVPVIIMTAFGTIPQAVQAIRDGAYEYVTKPFDLDVLKKVVQSSLSEDAQSSPAKPVRKKAKAGEFNFIAKSPVMLEVFETLKQVADSKASVLITGESGVGKEVVAKALHHFSSRASQPFVAVSCAALPETLLEAELFGHEKGAFTGATSAKMGRFELANKGTLFLDEIGEIPLPIQIKLLRVLQEREFERLGATTPTKVDVRLVTATNRNLQEAVEEGIFRLDLLYRLQVVEMVIPPLRERLEDIQPLSEFFLEKYCSENNRPTMTLSEEALHALQAYRWPGNVRELENMMERAVVLSSSEDTQVLAKHLPPAVKKAA